MQKLKAEGRIPENGVAELQELVMREFDRLQGLPERDLASEAIYYRTVGLSVASHYAFAVQSRILAINHIRMWDLPDAFDKRLVLSEKAKTRQKYGPQAILFTPEQLRITTFFVDRVRIHLQRRNPALGEPGAYLYASFRQPTKLANVSLQLKNVFIAIGGQ